MNKFPILILIGFCSILQAGRARLPPPPPPPEPEPEMRLPENNSSTGPANTQTGIKNIARNLTSPGTGVLNLGKKTTRSGDFGLSNLQINGGLTLTSFDDASVNSSGHFHEYRIGISGNITEDDILALGFSKTRYETGGQNGILARTLGTSLTWIHSLTDNYGIGVFGLVNDVDIEEINGNSYSYGYGLLFTTYHSFEYFDLTSATAVSHTEFDSGYDQFIMSTVNFSRYWTDSFATYASFTFVDSFKSDPSGDPTYGIYELGLIFDINDNLSFSTGYSKTEFLHNYNDNTFFFNALWKF